MRSALASVIGAALLSGCALLGKSAPVVPRLFTPEYDGEAAAAPPRRDLQLRLGRVEGWSHLRERIVVRDDDRELSFQEDRRWLERPEVYLRRALARSLFEERGLVEALSSRAVTLEVELIAFEEVRQPHGALLQARLVLLDERVVVLAETITVTRPVVERGGAEEARAVVEAFSQALREGVTRISERVVATLADRAKGGGN